VSGRHRRPPFRLPQRDIGELVGLALLLLAVLVLALGPTVLGIVYTAVTR